MNELRSARRAAVWVLPLDSGGCGASMQSIQALRAPRYAAALRRAGVSFVRSPRHADVVLITGALSEAARDPLRRVLESVPQPRVLIAVGSCAVDGCVFHDSSYVSASAAEELDTHVELAGCPPRPAAILAAIIEAQQLLTGDSATQPAGDDDEDATAPESTGDAPETDPADGGSGA